MQPFKEGVHEKLGHYVYRLIDPRNGRTFYIGMGQKDRVYDHVTGVLKDDGAETATTIKQELIQEILRCNLEPIHVIHRHDMDRKTAIEVEAALIDATPGLTNVVRGHGSREIGPCRVEQLNERYAREPEAFNLHRNPDPDRPVIVIKITGKSLKLADGDPYQAVRASWRMAETRLTAANAVPHFVLAVNDLRCVGVYDVSVNSWARDPSSPEHEPRYMFYGELANDAVRGRYMRKTFLNKRGEVDKGMRPVRFFSF